MKNNSYIQKRAENIQKERADAAATTIWLAIIALNNSLGIGKERILKFADALTKISAEFEEMKKSDYKYAMTKLEQRVNQIMK